MIGEISSKKSSIGQLTEQKTSKLSIHKREEAKVEEIREKVKTLQQDYEDNMRAINEKIESKTKESKKKILKKYLTLELSFKRDLNSRIRFGPYIEQPHFEKKI